jgi:hypothetical protein
LPLGLALVLLALAIPRTAAAIAELYAGDVGEFIGKDVVGSPAQVAQAAAVLQAADRRFGDAWARVRAGKLLVDLAYVVSPGGDRRLLGYAAADLASGLARAPAADAAAWTALAHARLGLGDPAAAARALGMSLRLDEYDPLLALWRTQLGCDLMARLDAAQRRQWAQQVLIAWQVARPGLVALAQRDPSAQALLSLALAAQPELLQQFEAALNGQ